jgi:hypothetical protein
VVVTVVVTVGGGVAVSTVGESCWGLVAAHLCCWNIFIARDVNTVLCSESRS